MLPYFSVERFLHYDRPRVPSFTNDSLFQCGPIHIVELNKSWIFLRPSGAD